VTEGTRDRAGSRMGLTDLMIAAVLTLIIALAGIAVGAYVLPGEHLDLPELQPGVRVAAEADFPIGASRLVSWGERIILVVRTGEMQYAALQGVSPKDGCVLEWDTESRRVVSPCGYVVFDLQGNVVTGLTREPLLRYPVFIRDGVVFVGRES